MDRPISNYRPADHLSEEYLLLLKMLIAFQMRLLFLSVSCNTNEEETFYMRLHTKSKIEEAVRVAGMFFALWCFISVCACVCAQRGPLGSLSFSICVCQGIFLRQTHTSSL